MRQLLRFPADAPAEQQLLAACLVLRDALRQGAKLRLKLPMAVHRQVTQAMFGAIFFDTLAAEFSDLDHRLQIRVHQAEDFEITSPSSGVPQ